MNDPFYLIVDLNNCLVAGPFQSYKDALKERKKIDGISLKIEKHFSFVAEILDENLKTGYLSFNTTSPARAKDLAEHAFGYKKIRKINIYQKVSHDYTNC